MKKVLIIFLVAILTLSTINIVNALNINKTIKSRDYNNSLDRFDYQDKFALIITGSYGGKNQEEISGHPREKYYEWYTASVQKRFDILTSECYNFNPSNIYVLLTEIDNESFIPFRTFNSSKFVNYYNATKENITMVFNKLSNIIDENDLLVIDLINHGGDEGRTCIPIIKKYIDKDTGIDAHDTYMALEQGGNESKSKTRSKSVCVSNDLKVGNLSFSSSNKFKLYDYELANLVDQINAHRILFILQPCLSGGFINDLSKENHIIITASKETQMAGDFLGPFNKGMDGVGDLDKDGRISIAEIFQYTIDNLYEKGFDPMIDDNGDKKGSIDLNSGDGQVAAGIYDLSYEEIVYEETDKDKPRIKFTLLDRFSILEKFINIIKF